METIGARPKRLRYLDMTKGLGIFLITLGHIQMGNPVKNWGSLFKIAIFYVVSGYLLAMKGTADKTSFGQYARKQLRSILVPYLSFSGITIVIRAVYTAMKGRDVMANVTENLFLTVTLKGIGPLWFLPGFLIGGLIFFAIVKSRSRLLMGATLVWPIVVAVVAQKLLYPLPETVPLAVSYPCLAIAKGLVAVWFMQVGYLGYFVLEKLRALPSYRFVGPGLGLALSLFTVWLSFHAPHIDFNGMQIGDNPTAFFLGGVTGSFGAMLIFEFLEKYFRLELFTYFGENSLILMASQRSLLLINLATAAWEGVFRREEECGALYFAETLGIFALILLMDFGVTEFINRKAPFLVGKRRKRPQIEN
ncbi:MAG: acyltransferase [Clostridiales bacterium]|nr:acyltransferase [Clostridiales bacterium]